MGFKKLLTDIFVKPKHRNTYLNYNQNGLKLSHPAPLKNYKFSWTVSSLGQAWVVAFMYFM